MRGVLFTTDLACSSQVAGAASLQGLEVDMAMSLDALLEKAAGCGLVLLDLNSSGADPAGLVPKLKALDPAPSAIVAFGPHVHEAKLAAAREARCDEVLTRGQFHGQLAELLQRFLTA